ncbi:MAG: carboxypeptidase-like regulatory domain-containing protein, partial [Bacteroidia bacterium]|nr:carboxypeptidase-like regulatory domain-containing protein [Bacteroidia bacterium]
EENVSFVNARDEETGKITQLVIDIKNEKLRDELLPHISIRDKETNQPIGSASIILKNSRLGTSSNDQGVFKFDLNGFPSMLFIQCMGYLRDTVVIENESQFISSFKNQNRVFFLKPSPIQINEVQVKARSTLFENDPYAIIDYKIVGKRIVALGFKNGNEFRKEVLLADLSGKLISNYNYRNLDSLYQDCQGNVFAFCSDSVLELKPARKGIIVQDRYRRAFIADFIVPVCGISDSLIFVRKTSVNHQYENYFGIRDSQNVMVVYSTGGMLKESAAASLFNSWKQQAQVPVSIKYYDGGGDGGGGGGGRVDKDQSGEPVKIISPVTVKESAGPESKDNNKKGDSMGPVWISYMNAYDGLYHSYFESQFRLLVDYPPIFTKMIPVGRYHLIFNREAATIFWIDEKGGIGREVGMITRLNGIHYHDIHLDTGTGKIYVEYPQGPFTHFVEINPETGQEIRRFMVSEFRHIEKCEFLNDRLYFLYQPDTGKRIKKIFSIWI